MFVKRSIPLSIVAILILSIFVMVPEVEEASGSEDIPLDPTRAYVQESESNNGWDTADAIPGTQGRYELHGNLTRGDNDFFLLNLNGGNGPNVDRIDISYQYLDTNFYYDTVFVLIHAFYSPTTADQPNANNEILLDLKYYQEGFPWLGAAFAEAGYTGKYGIRLIAQNTSNTQDPLAITGTIKYNFTVSISSVTPNDNNNDEDNPAYLTGGITGSMDQNEDFMDWFEIIALGSTHPTVVDLDIDFPNPTPNDTNTGLQIHYGIQIDLYVRYNSRSNPGVFTSEKYSISPNPTFQKAGLRATPFRLNMRKNCTKIEIGMVMYSFGISSISPNINQKTYSTQQAATSFTFSGDIYTDIPNKRPVLRDAAVTPTTGRSTDNFRFSVKYFDTNNETPEQIWLWRDGQEFKQLSPIPGGSSMNHVFGVEYYVEVPGTILGKNKVHVMNFSASDGKDWALDTENALGSFLVTVDDNSAPYTTKGDIFRVDLSEDQESEEIVVDELFSDADAMNDLSFFINSSRTGWTTGSADFPMFIATLTLPRDGETETKLNIIPKADIYGSTTLEIKAVDDGFGYKEAFVTLDIQIAEVNDDPEIMRVERKSLDGRESLTFMVKQLDEQDLDILAEDRDGDDLTFSWDIEEHLADPVEGVNFFMNSSTGECWVLPDDADVPQLEFNLFVEDGRGGKAEVNIILEVEDINDPPTIMVPESRSTVEGEFLYINPEFHDPDLDGDELLVFSYDLGDLELVIPQNAVEFDLATGRLVIKALSEKMNGEWDVTITVSDKEFDSASGTCHIEIQNINDRPEIDNVYPEIEDNNLTVSFSTSEASDEDGDNLKYIWDFGDGTPVVEGSDLKYVDHEYAKGGSYTVTLKLFDGEAYSNELTVLISVTEPIPDPDQDSDGIDDVWEILYGLDPSDPSDAALDFDNDGLTNLEEFTYNRDYDWQLNPWDPDTDDDGWKDGEEVKNSFDPMDVSSHPEDQYKDMPTMLYLITVVIAVIALMILIVAFILMKRNKPKAMAAMASVPMDYQMMQPADGGYTNTIPPVTEMQSLPPAQQPIEAQQPHDQYPTEEQVPDINDPYQQQDIYNQYPDQTQQPPYQDPMYQDPVYQEPGYQEPQQDTVYQPPAPGSEELTPSVPDQTADIPMSEEPIPEQIPEPPIQETSVPPEEPAPVPPEVDTGEPGKSNGIPPPPGLPEI